MVYLKTSKCFHMTNRSRNGFSVLDWYYCSKRKKIGAIWARQKKVYWWGSTDNLEFLLWNNWIIKRTIFRPFSCVQEYYDDIEAWNHIFTRYCLEWKCHIYLLISIIIIDIFDLTSKKLLWKLIHIIILAISQCWIRFSVEFLQRIFSRFLKFSSGSSKLADIELKWRC